MTFPTTRLRRLRRTHTLRRMIQETRVSTSDLVFPIFVTHGQNIRTEVASMPGIYQISLDHLSKEIREIASLGIEAVLLFGIPETKDSVGTESYKDDGTVQDAVRLIKRETPDLAVITDLCLCEYTDHGHCGIIVNDTIANDLTLDLLSKIAVSQASSGADLIAPSGMIDGQVGSIRTALDKAGFHDTGIMAYSSKYASAFYGPFRDAVDAAPKFGDRKTHQMDPPNSRQAIREIELDITEGADIVMVKPAIPYLDVLAKVKETFTIPVAAYNVSGEYSMVKGAANNDWLDGPSVAMEILTAIKRAGADMIITYHAKEVAKFLDKRR